MKNNKFIGVFDSGFGGLTIMREIINQLPKYNYIYFGDSARAPYGNRAQSEIYKFSSQAVDFLFSKNCELIIFACNTASAEALRKIQQEYLPKKYPNKRVLGVIIPACEVAVKMTKNNNIGVMATNSTVASKTFTKEIKKLNKNINIIEVACPELVPIIESGEHKKEKVDIFLRKYLKQLIEKDIDILILGCTHYEVLKDKIKKLVPRTIQVLSESVIVAHKLKDYLARHPEIEEKLGKQSNIAFYTTDLTNRFKRLGSEFFGSDIAVKVAKIS